MDWLDEEINLQNSNDLLPMLSMTKIKVHLWQMKNKETIRRKTWSLDVSNNTICFNSINKIIKENEYVDGLRYRIVDYFLLNMDIDSLKTVEMSILDVNTISQLIQTTCIKPLQIYQSIFINPSLFIFHKLNAIFIIMEELKPILKSSHYTKRIRDKIHEEHSKTMKSYP